MLTDKLNPRQFAELIDLDIEVADMLYSAYAPVSYTHLDVYKRQPFFCAQYSRSVMRSLLPFKRSIW